MKKIVSTLEQAAKITRRELIKGPNGFESIRWWTSTHTMTIQKAIGRNDQLLVFGEPRVLRARVIWVLDPSERYLKTLRPKLLS